MECFRWLHLTDLHWESIHHKDYWGTIQPGWFDDIDLLQEKCGGPWDAVFFTGDLTNKGTKKEFTALTERLRDLFDHLKAKGSNPHLIAVPGNHDLVRPNPKSPGCKMLTKFWADDEDTQQAVWRKDTGSEAWKIIRKSFKNFTQWYGGAAKAFNIPGGMTPGLLPGEFSVTLPKGSIEIGVLGLNTAFLQLGEGDFEGKLDAHPAQVTAVCGEFHQQWVERHDACLLLTHHPMEWLSAHGREAYKSVIARSGRFVLHLCGHQHEAAMEEKTLAGADAGRRVLCGNSIFGMKTFTDWKGDSQIDRRHGYSAGIIDFSGSKPELRIWPRRMDKKGDGVWGFNQDTSFHLEPDEGIKAVSFESTRKQPSSVIVPPEEPEVAVKSGGKTSGEGSDAASGPVSPDTGIRSLVKENIQKILSKPRMKCFSSVLQRMFGVKKEGGDEAGQLVGKLLTMDLLDAIMELHQAVRECIGDLKDEGRDETDIKGIWDYCVTILGWLVLTGVKEEWACEAAREFARKGATLELMIPVETEVGVDIAVSRLNEVKAGFSLDESSLRVKARGRIPSETWQVESGWSLKENVLTVKKQLWKQLNPLDPSKDVPVTDEQLTRDLKRILHIRRRMGENHYMVVNPPDKLYPQLEEEVYRALMRDLQNLNIFYLGAAGEEGMAIVAETELQAQIREFLLIKTTIKDG